MGNALEISKSLGLLKKYTADLHAMIEDGSFYHLSFTERFKLIRRIRKLYNKLRGPVSALKLKHVVAAAGVLALNTACFVPVGVAPSLMSGGTLIPGAAAGAGSVVFNQFFVPRESNAFGIYSLDSSIESYNPDTGEYYFQDMIGSASAFVDMDGDGDLDIVHAGVFYRYSENPITGEYSESSGAIMVWQENTGTPTEPEFGPHQPLPFDNLPFAGAPAFADMDADGDQDLWLATHNIYGLSPNNGNAFFENTGNAADPYFAFRGVYGEWSYLYYEDYVEYAKRGIGGTPSGPPIPQDIILSDVDGDGDFDILVAGHNYYGEFYGGYVTLFENTGTGTAPQFDFESPVYNPFGLDDVIRSYAWNADFVTGFMVDVDRDGDLDIVASAGYVEYGSFYGGLVVIENTGDAVTPVFEEPMAYIEGLYIEGRVGMFPQPVDIDGDGDLDVFAYEPARYSYTEGYIEGAAQGQMLFLENVPEEEWMEWIEGRID